MTASASGPLLESLTTAFRLLKWVAALAAIAILVSGITVVKPDEVALRLRFGKLTGRTRADQVHGPGLLVALPYLVDEVIRVPVKRVQEMRIEALAGGPDAIGDRLDVTATGYALTADHNIVQPAAVLKYQITDPVAWTLRIVAPEAVIRDAVVSALTRTLGEMTIDAVLVDGQRRLAAQAIGRAQERLDEDGQWVRLLALEFTALRPPPQVARDFDDVQSAFVERKTRVDEARGYREQALPQAAADGQGRVRQAEADEAAHLAEARGAAATFLAIREEYRRNPAVVHQRLYREAMERALSTVGGRILVPPGSDTGRILIPSDNTPGEWTGPGGS
ncbi:MAG TPA: protease modulator HflK [Methylomirabilota bacterium]|jgi:membrane protease subunit HflK|nr:protease modulator HflK [Methylomirabilota bacterium]